MVENLVDILYICHWGCLAAVGGEWDVPRGSGGVWEVPDHGRCSAVSQPHTPPFWSLTTAAMLLKNEYSEQLPWILVDSGSDSKSTKSMIWPHFDYSG